MVNSTSEGEKPESSASQKDRDRIIDFSKYSTAQLVELQHHIDPAKSPENFTGLVRELQARTNAEEPATDGKFRIRFTAANGLRGWMEALWNSLPLYGAGFIEIYREEIVLHALRRTWLGIPVEGNVLLAPKSICNVIRVGDQIEFTTLRRWRSPSLWRFRVESVENASRLESMLPANDDTTSQQLQTFNRKIRELNRHTLLTPLLILANVAVFVAMAISARTLGAFDLIQLTNWGANNGALAVSGQWWRLFTCLFVHINLLHLILNMWVLWSVGRATERFYGSFVFLLIYVSGGALASLSSLIWNPIEVSVGASGAIFGMLGAFLAFLTRRQTGVPASIIRSHWLPTLLFALFNLVSGLTQVGVDNAAHVGGFVGGFGLGLLLAQPIYQPASRRSSRIQIVRASALALASCFLAVWYLAGFGPTIPQQFEQAHNWLTLRANDNVRDWLVLASEAHAGTVSDEVLAERFEHDILPFWRDTHSQLQVEIAERKDEKSAYARLVDGWVESRLKWAQAIIEVARSEDQRRAQDALILEQQANLAQARLERVQLLAAISQDVRPLRDRSFFLAIKNFISAHGQKCVEKPAGFEVQVSEADSRTDGPAKLRATGCLAQRLFLTGDYAALDRLIAASTRTLADLPDGSSSLGGELNGLDDLFEYGQIDVAEALGRTSDWHKLVPGSTIPDLVNALLFDVWAYSARGTDYASKVSPQAMLLFGYRSEMAAAGLNEVEQHASSNPLWYQLSLLVGRNQNVPLAKLQATFDRAHAKFPQYLPLYSRMLNILMPRWYGSYEMVDQFILKNSKSQGSSTQLNPEMYARLYSIYAGLEGNDFDVVQSARANRNLMKSGLLALTQRYPKSDFILNLYARFLCSDGDAVAYRAIRPVLDKHASATAWSENVSINSCDAMLLHFQRPLN